MQISQICEPRHLHESQNLGGAAGGRTPFGAGARTPARTPGHVTPGHMSVRQPNPYTGATPSALGPPASSYGLPPQTPYGYQTPSAYPPRTPSFAQQPPVIPPGMNPARAAMIQNSGGWGPSDSQW